MINRFSEFQQMARRTSSPQIIHLERHESGESIEDGTVEKDVELGVIGDEPYSLEIFIQKLKNIEAALERIKKSTIAIDKLHKQALSAVNVEEATRISQRIEASVAKTNSDANMIRRTIRELDMETRQYAEYLSASDGRMRKSKQAIIAKNFIKVMRSFESMQKTNQGKYKNQLERQYLIVKPMATREELDHLTAIEEDGTSHVILLNQQIFSLANRAQAQETLDEMKERQADILQIERSLAELHQIFVDMNMIVEQQGELINKVGDHVHMTLEHTERAKVEVQGAVVKQRGIQRKKWILTIVLLVLLVIVGVVIFASFKWAK